MKLIKCSLLLMSLLMSSTLFAKGGDDVGNGGFAYKQSVKILKMATTALEEKIRISTLKDIVDYPERREILADTLLYANLDKLSKKNHYRGGRKLAMNYIVNPPTVIVLKSYFEAFMGKTDPELEEASLEVQKRLLHEASHIWGYKEADSEKFSIAFLKNVDSSPEEESSRPSDISVRDFCSCINGRSEVGKRCDKFCAANPSSNGSILHASTILGAESLMKFGSLYNWCSVQLSGDLTKPQCALQATSGDNSSFLPIIISPGSSSFIANISSLENYKVWDLKLIEYKTGSSAQTETFKVKKIDPYVSDVPMGSIKLMGVNQYTCMHFGGKFDSQGNVIRTSFARLFYYFQNGEIPTPMPPAPGGRLPMTACHDEQIHPGNDSAEYERLEKINNHLVVWDFADKFLTALEGNGKLLINRILKHRLADEFNIYVSDLDLFQELNFLKRPGTSSILGRVLTPFTNTDSERSICPTVQDYTSNQPLFNLLGDYIGDTEALYIAEKEAEIIGDGALEKTIYGTMLIKENIINKYGFYIENGLKTKITEDAKHTNKTIFYYWPVSDAMDPMIKGPRKLFTVKNIGELSGSINGIMPLRMRTTDKRIGCIPKIAD